MSDSSVPSQGFSYTCTVSPSVVVTEVVDPFRRLNMSAVSTVIDPVSAEWVITVPVRPSVRAVKVRSETEIASGSTLRSMVSLSLSKFWIVSCPVLALNRKRVLAGAAGERVVAEAADQGVVAGAADDQIVAFAAVDGVVAAVAEQDVAVRVAAGWCRCRCRRE